MHNSRPSAVVVNDDPVQLVVLGGFLNHAGIEARTFEHVEDALRAMTAGAPPDLVVTDLYMPGIDGWRFCRLLRSPEYAAFNDIPILVVSATFAGDYPERIATDVGADAFLAAPVDGKQYVALARALLQGEKMRRLPRALVVEDSKTLASLLKKTLVAGGYRADTVFTFSEAEAAVADADYDVAVLDYHLPDGEGDALIDVLRNRSPHCVCLMMTTDPSPKLGMDWMKRGAAAYLRKPFEPELLIELCERARRERALLRAQDLLEVRTKDLRESSRRYRELFENSRDGFVVVDTQGRFLGANRAFCAMLGYSLEELKAKEDFYAVTPERWRAWERDVIWRKRLLTTGESGVYEKEYLRKNGTIFPVELQSFTVKDDQGHVQYLWGIARDISERKRMEAERERLQAQVAQMQKMESIGRLASGVAHDFNNMLSVVLGHTELAMGSVGEDHPLRADLVEIQTAAQRSAELTRQLLAFARKQEVLPKTLDLKDAVSEILSMLGRLIGEQIDLIWKPAHDLWPVRIDPSQLDQILVNLCVNARDAIAGSGTITIETRNVFLGDECPIQDADCVPGAYVCLIVGDDGCGMDAGTLDHLFEPFFTTKEKGRGTGLGLATVYGAVKQNNGFIDVQSCSGQGTTFSVYFPRHIVHSAQDDEVSADGS